MARDYYSVSEAAKALGISVDTLRRWDRTGKIKADRDTATAASIPASEIDRLRGEPGGEHAQRAQPLQRHRHRRHGRGPAWRRSRWSVSDPVRLVAVVTRDAVQELDLRPGMAATAIVKSTSVMVQR